MFSIPAVLDGGEWIGPPYKRGRASVTGWYGDYPLWRQEWDHDNDRSTPPKDMGPHKALDLFSLEDAEEELTPVMAGQVAYAGFLSLTPGRGDFVWIDHGDGWSTRYLHMNRIDVETGDLVDVGDVLGVEGWTGYVTGRHVHFEVENKAVAKELGVDPRMGGRLNPVDYLEANIEQPPTLDRLTFEELYVSQYYLSGGSHGGTRSMADPRFIAYAEDGKTERWEMQLLRPAAERPDA